MRTPHFAPLPATCLVDETLCIRVLGVQKGDRVGVRLASAGASGSMWLSMATFVAGGTELDLTRDAPVSGSYEGADAMGLFWSRVATPSVDGEVHADPMTLTLSAAIEGAGRSTPHHIRRSFGRDGLRHLDVCEDGVIAKLFEPDGLGPHPAVLVVGGSGGAFQWSGEMAALLASRGFAALAVAYFGLPGLPATLDRIPIEYFGNALRWLQRRPSVDAERIGVIGASRGGELAFLLGATYSTLRVVIAYVPSGILWSGYPPSGHAAWTWQGRELPFANHMPRHQFARLLASEHAIIVEGVRDNTPNTSDPYLPAPAAVAAATIPVERINGPVMMVTGQADEIWPCERLTTYALQRMRACKFVHRVEHLSYPGAGHGICWPNVITAVTRFKHPVSGAEINLGGSAAANAHASRDSWPRMLAFLRDSL